MKNFDMEAKYLFFNELELDSTHRFSLNFKENDSVKQIHFHQGNNISSQI